MSEARHPPAHARQLLIAVLDAAAPTMIRFNEDDGLHDLSINVASAADAHALVNALHMRDARESGQPHPIATTPTCWSGYYNGKLLGWDVLIHFDAPFAGEYITSGTPRAALTASPSDPASRTRAGGPCVSFSACSPSSASASAPWASSPWLDTLLKRRNR
jgi:hypothetical protein